MGSSNPLSGFAPICIATVLPFASSYRISGLLLLPEADLLFMLSKEVGRTNLNPADERPAGITADIDDYLAISSPDSFHDSFLPALPSKPIGSGSNPSLRRGLQDRNPLDAQNGTG